MQNIIVGLFEVESEGYQALTELKQNPGDATSFVSQAILVKKEGEQIRLLDSFDTGAAEAEGSAIGGLIGMCFGILGGPVGMLLGGSLGSLAGMGADAIDNASLLEQISGKLEDGVALIGLTDEESEDILDEKLSKYKITIARFDAAVVAQEVDAAREMQMEMARQAREQLRKQKTNEFKNKVDEQRAKVKAHLDEVKAKFKS